MKIFKQKIRNIFGIDKNKYQRYRKITIDSWQEDSNIYDGIKKKTNIILQNFNIDFSNAYWGSYSLLKNKDLVYLKNKNNEEKQIFLSELKKDTSNLFILSKFKNKTFFHYENLYLLIIDDLSLGIESTNEDFHLFVFKEFKQPFLLKSILFLHMDYPNYYFYILESPKYDFLPIEQQKIVKQNLSKLRKEFLKFRVEKKPIFITKN